MGKIRDKTTKLDRWISVTSLVISAIAVVFAWQANKIAREANELTQQSIRVAQESNRIALLDKPDPQTIRGTGTIPLSVYGCRYSSSDLYHVYSVTDVYITFANNGGKVATLSQVELMGTPYSWHIKIYQDDAAINLPVQILPGVETRLHFVATSVSNSDSETNITTVYEERYHSYPMLRWTFYFNDGRVIVWETQAYGSSPGLDFSRSCE
ncbi:MAG: hypothetical protein ACPLF9_08435 [Methanothermobacter tenebrarum]